MIRIEIINFFMNVSTTPKLFLLSFLLLLQSRAISQEFEESNYDSAHAFYTVRVNDSLPRYILHWVREYDPQDEDGSILDKIEVRKEDDTTLLQIIGSASMEGIFDFKMYDVNGDGFADIEITSGNPEFSNTSTTSFVLFNRQTGLFEDNPNFSSFVGATIDEDNHLIHTMPENDKSGSVEETYRVGQRTPILIERWVNGEYHSTHELLIGDSLVTIARTTVTDLANSDTLWERQITDEALIDNEWRIVKKRLLKPLSQPLNQQQRQSDVYIEDIRGTFRFLEEESYTYGTDNQGIKYADVQKRIVVGDRWVAQEKRRQSLR